MFPWTENHPWADWKPIKPIRLWLFKLSQFLGIFPKETPPDNE